MTRDDWKMFAMIVFCAVAAAGGIAWEIYTKLALIHAVRGCR